MEQMAGVGVEVKLLASRLVRSVLSVFVLNMMLGLWMETVSTSGIIFGERYTHDIVCV